MLRFGWLRFRNFFSVGQNPVKVDLGAPGVTLLEGDNGSGKTTVLNALWYVLFGKSFKRLNIPQMVNNINGRDMLVILEASRGSRTWEIRRGTRPGIFTVSEAGVEKDFPNSRETQRFVIDEIVGADEHLFRQTVAVCSNYHVPFMLLPLGDRRRIVDRVLGIDAVAGTREVAKEELGILKGEKALLSVEGSRLAALSDASVSKIRFRHNLLEDQISKAREREAGERMRISSLLEEADAEKIRLARMPDVMELSARAARFRTSAAEAEGRLAVCIHQADEARKQALFYSENTSCPVCGQEIAERERLEADARNKADEAGKKAESMASERESMLMKASEADSEADDVRRIVESYRDRKTKMHELSKNVIWLRDEIKRLENEAAQPDEDCSEEMRNLSESVRENERLTDENNISMAETEFVMQHFSDSGVRTAVVARQLPLVNSLVERHSATIDFSFRFTFDTDFSETIFDSGGRKVEYASLSAGEQARFDLIVMFAFRDVARFKSRGDTGLMFFDEALDGVLDKAGAAALNDLISAQDGVSVFIATHSPETYADVASRRLAVSKPEGFTRISSLET